MKTQPSKALEPKEPRGGTPARRPHRLRRVLQAIGAMLLVYLLAAYVVIPLIWKKETARHPGLYDAPRITHTVNGIPGDPVNLALLGSEAEIIRGMLTAKWFPADPITLR